MKKYILLILLIISCKNDGILSDSEVKETKKAIIENGNQDAYSRLLIYYEEKGDYEIIMPYSIIMAYKYNNADAYYNIYKSIIRLNNKGKFNPTLINSLNLKSKKFALDNLSKSSDLGNVDAKIMLSKIGNVSD